MGPFGDNAHHGHVQNPWRAGHVAGGSSSGSGAAVSAGLAWGALGSDTGGSIRLPAACCGIVGLKPTYGRVSRAGAMALSWSNDHIGPMTRTVRDTALMLGIIAGRDPLDATSSPRAVPDYLASIEGGIAGLRVGSRRTTTSRGFTPRWRRASRAALAALEARGARRRDPGSRPADHVRRVQRDLALGGLRDPRAPLPGAAEEIQPVVRARLALGFAVRPTTICRPCGSGRR